MHDDRAKIVTEIVLLAVLACFVILIVFVTWYHFFNKSSNDKDRGFLPWLRDVMDLFFGL